MRDWVGYLYRAKRGRIPSIASYMNKTMEASVGASVSGSSYGQVGIRDWEGGDYKKVSNVPARNAVGGRWGSRASVPGSRGVLKAWVSGRAGERGVQSGAKGRGGPDWGWGG